MGTVVATQTALTMDWSAVFANADFSVLVSGITTVIPIILPVLMASYGIKAAWRFARKSLRGAGKI